MRSQTILFGLAALAMGVAPLTLSAMPPAEAWAIGPWVRGKNYSIGMPARPRPGPGDTLEFDFPVAGRGQVDAMTTRVYPLEGARSLTLHYRVDAKRGTRFVPDEDRDQTATVSLYIQRAGDNWSAKGRFASYRWYVPVRAVIPLTPGEHEVTVRFDERWTNVRGKGNDEDPAGYRAALADTETIGIAFGSRSRRSHGVHATGPATFRLIDLAIR